MSPAWYIYRHFVQSCFPIFDICRVKKHQVRKRLSTFLATIVTFLLQMHMRCSLLFLNAEDMHRVRNHQLLTCICKLAVRSQGNRQKVVIIRHKHNTSQWKQFTHNLLQVVLWWNIKSWTWHSSESVIQLWWSKYCDFLSRIGVWFALRLVTYS